MIAVVIYIYCCIIMLRTVFDFGDSVMTFVLCHLFCMCVTCFFFLTSFMFDCCVTEFVDL
jgi:hypothetical protein